MRPGFVVKQSALFAQIAFLPLACGHLCAPALAAERPLGSWLDLTQERPHSPPVAGDAPMTATVVRILSRMTIDEKIAVVHLATDPDQGKVGSVGYFAGIPRLGIPVRRDADALGIQVIKPSTALPSRIGWAASFDRAAVLAAGQLVGSEGRALDVDLVYAPQLDLARLSNWGRSNATFGEDPFLSGQLGIQEIEGIQSQGLMAQVKHFAFYNGQAGAEYYRPGGPALPTIVDEQTAHELYLKPFEYAVTYAKPSSIMLSYQGIRIKPIQKHGSWSTENKYMLQDVIRNRWKFIGFTESDYDAVHSVSAIVAGTDVDSTDVNATDLGVKPKNYYASDLGSLVDPSSKTFNKSYAAALDRAVADTLYQYERFGLLPSDGGAVGASPRPRIETLKGPHIHIAEKLAEEAAVLLKNENASLPLKTTDLASLVVIGPSASQLMVDGNQWERSRGFPDRDAISTLEMLERLAPAESHIRYAQGIDWNGKAIPATAFSGLTRTGGENSGPRVDGSINYDATSDGNDLAPGSSYTWDGSLTISVDDTYSFWIQRSWLDGLFVSGHSTKIIIDGVERQLLPPGTPAATYPAGIVPMNGTNEGFTVKLKAGAHHIVVHADIPEIGYYPIDAFAPVPVQPPVTFRLAWSRLGDTIAAAASAAKEAKTVLLFVDDNGLAEDEAGIASRNAVEHLPATEEALIEAVTNANPNTIVVMSTGNPVLMPWLSKAKAVLENWYPGQEGATAIAKLLLGQAVPSGKTPMTWPASNDQTPFAAHPERVAGDGKAVYYSEGLLMGYRWYDAKRLEPLFPFGYGLSYTSFRYSDLEIRPDLDGLTVQFTITNIGAMRGAEVPQVYAAAPVGLRGVQLVPQKLVGFDRVELSPGEKKNVTIKISKRELSYWSTKTHDWILPSGSRDILVGSSSRDIKLKASSPRRIERRSITLLRTIG